MMTDLTRSANPVNDVNLVILPTFPDFKKLQLSDREIFDHRTEGLKPYSNFNFTTVWNWNINDTLEVSAFHDNLVIKFEDILTGRPFLSFLGTNEVQQTIEGLLRASEETGCGPSLRLIPDCFEIDSDLRSRYNFVDDRDNFDYILSVHDLHDLSGHKFREKRKHVRQFERFYDSSVHQVDIYDLVVQSQLLDLFHLWETRKADEFSTVGFQQELTAFRRLLSSLASTNAPRVGCLGVNVERTPVGFVIFEVLNSGYGAAYFEKADIELKGIYPFLKNRLAMYLEGHNCTYVNFEEDLGLPGLRKSKLSYHPAFFLKKHIVSYI
jgi:hypothetical protein